MFDAAFGIAAFFMAHDDAGLAAETTKSANEGVVVRECTVTCERREILDQPADVVGEMRTVLMARDLDLLLRRQAAIGLFQKLVGLDLHLADFVGDVQAACAADIAQFRNLAFEFQDRFFKVQFAHDLLFLPYKDGTEKSGRHKMNMSA